MNAVEKYCMGRREWVPKADRSVAVLTIYDAELDRDRADAAIAELKAELKNAAELVLAYSQKMRAAQDENRHLFDRAAKDEDRAEQAEAELADCAKTCGGLEYELALSRSLCQESLKQGAELEAENGRLQCCGNCEHWQNAYPRGRYCHADKHGAQTWGHDACHLKPSRWEARP